jgi:hypothetical protein
MKHLLTRSAGIALVVAGIAGLVFCIAGLFVLARVQQQIETVALENLELIEQALAATAEGLAVAETSLAQTTSTIALLADTAAGAGQALEETVPTVEAVSDLVGQQLPAAVESTQETLRSAATSAQLVDDLLALITSIPLLGTEQYNPDVPFHQGLAGVADGLDGIPASLISARAGLDTASGSLQGLGDDLASMANSIGEIASSIESAQTVLSEYQDIVADLQSMTSDLRQALPQWLRILRLAISLALVWLGIAQIGLFTQGWELISRSRPPS